jgi:DNA-binding transcriptional ArsR family regulator
MLLPDIQRALKLKVSTIRAKLQMLRACGLVEVENQGRWLRFRLASDRRPLIEQIFSEYDDEVGWDADITVAKKILLNRSSRA